MQVYASVIISCLSTISNYTRRTTELDELWGGTRDVKLARDRMLDDYVIGVSDVTEDVDRRHADRVDADGGVGVTEVVSLVR